MDIKLLWNLYHWIEKKLNRKYILGMASGLLAISVLFAILFIGMYQKQLTNERANTSLHLNKLLQTSLENSMLKRDLNGLRDILTDFGQQDEIQRVMIFNPQGIVRFSSEKQFLGNIDHQIGNTTKDKTVFLESESTGEVLRSINPIYNKAECGVCHGDKKKNPINGVLVVDFDASTLRKHARNTTLVLMGAGSTVMLITLFGGWWFMGQFVLKPVKKLLNAQEKFALGDLKVQVNLKGNDEISRLGKSFNNMVQTIEKQWNTINERQQFLQSLINGIPDGIRVLDQDNNILLYNKAYAEQFTGNSESIITHKCYAIHQRDEPCIPTMETCPLYEIKKNGRPVKTVHHHINNNKNETLSVEIFAAPIDAGDKLGKEPIIIEVIRDLSKTVDYSQEQRLTALGMLASGVAHEIHNPLGSIQIAFQSIDQLIDADEPVIDQLKYYVKLIEGEIDKCVDITGRLLKLGSLPDTHLQPIDVKMVISETISLLKWEAASKNIKMSLKASDKTNAKLRVMATDNELRMMVLNLIQNAFHAMPDGGDLFIRIQTSNNNKLIQIIIEDTGVGISKEMQKRIFDPFFSHRSDNNKGTGLGLSITQAIIKRFKGKIEVKSQLGKGSTFTIILPNADAE